jgi:hypothetical protein
MKKSDLVIGEVYWIFSGTMKPIEGTLRAIVNNGHTAIFGSIARKVTSVYKTKEEALRINKY